MCMTRSRRSVYEKKWYYRECHSNMKFRRKEYNRKIRHSKITEDASSRAYNKNLTKLVWNTIT